MRRGPWGSGKCWQSVQAGAAARAESAGWVPGAAPFTWGLLVGTAAQPE